MKKKQMAQLGVALGLVGAIGVGGTLALMTQTSNAVVNTFTVGNALVDGDITLDEAKMKNAQEPTEGNVWEVSRTDPTDQSGYDYNKVDNDERVQANHYLDLQPGDDIYKDPTVHIAKDTADCYVFINVSGISSLESKGLTVDDTNNYLEAASNTYKWVPMEKNTTAGGDGIYYLADTNNQPLVVNSETSAQNYMVFESLDAGDNMYDDKGNSKISDSDNITVTACAVQAKGTDFESAKEVLPDEFTGNASTGEEGQE